MYIQQQADAHANALLDFGLVKGHTVAIWLRESPEKVRIHN